MSNRDSKRPRYQHNEHSLLLEEIVDLKTLIKDLVCPLVEQVKILNETLNNLSNTIYRRERTEISKSCEFTNSNIGADVSLIGVNMHKVHKDIELLKERSLNQGLTIETMTSKLANIDKMMPTYMRTENTRKSFQQPEQVWQKLVSMEQLLMCLVDHQCISSDSLIKGSGLNKPYQVSAALGLDSTMQLITLNSELDYPDGTWLGDPSQLTSRVRCPISKESLEYVTTRCCSPEKMALALIDLLFTKETLAMSNLSGKSKLGKKQLDPLMIYGIKCHLTYVFNINEKLWYKIKQNIDSKCRTAWKKRKLIEDENAIHNCKSLDHVDDALQEYLPVDVLGKQVRDRDLVHELNTQVLQSRVIHTIQGDIEVLHRTPLRYHDVQILDSDHVLPVINTEVDDCDTVIGLSLSKSSTNSDENITIITKEEDDAYVTEPMLQVLTDEELDLTHSALKVQTSED